MTQKECRLLLADELIGEESFRGTVGVHATKQRPPLPCFPPEQDEKVPRQEMRKQAVFQMRPLRRFPLRAETLFQKLSHVNFFRLFGCHGNRFCIVNYILDVSSACQKNSVPKNAFYYTK